MNIIMNKSKIFSLQNYFFAFLTITCISLSLSSCGGEGKDYVEETVEDPTQGIIAEIEEVKTDIFKINNEEIIEKREDSRIIATFMSGKIDTFTLDEISLKEYNDPVRSGVRTAVYGGLMGYMLGRRMSSPLTRSSYKTDKAYAGSNTTKKSALRSTASKRIVRTPKASKSGYGSRKSTRSYGG